MLIRLPFLELAHDSHASHALLGTAACGLRLHVQRRSYQDDGPYWAVGVQRAFSVRTAWGRLCGWRTLWHRTLSRRP